MESNHAGNRYTLLSVNLNEGKMKKLCNNMATSCRCVKSLNMNYGYLE